MQPIIKTNAWYTLVTAKNEVINASWCKQQLARILKKSTDTITSCSMLPAAMQCLS